jgi:glucosamine-phosphate N-acetyltransferase
LDLTIEELCAADLKKGFLDSLASLADAALTYEEALKVFQARLRAGQRTYVAKIADRVVGTATLLVERKFIHHGGLVGHIEDVAVHKDYQRKGIGTSLVKHITEEARKLGCYKVILNCFENVAPFYMRLGYRKHDLGLRIDWK